MASAVIEIRVRFGVQVDVGMTFVLSYVRILEVFLAKNHLIANTQIYVVNHFMSR